jgi:subtilisin family serine protease
MRKSRIILILSALSLLVAQFAQASPGGPGPTATDGARRYRPSVSASLDAVPGEVNVLYRRGVEPASRAAVVSRMDALVVAREPSIRMQTLRVDPADLAASIERLNRMPGVAWAEPNFRLQPTTNDPFFGDEWALANSGQAHLIADPPPATSIGTSDADVDAEEAWATQTGAGAVIAVIDSGVDTDHPDLVNQLTAPSTWRNFASDGAPTDPNPNPAEEGFSHGTHVAGIIAAEQENTIGVSGICPACEVMPIRFGFTVASEVQAIAWAVDHGADVINASFGGGPWSKAERKAIKVAGADGVLFVAAAGNDAVDNDIATFNQQGDILSPSFPASYELPSILAVAASNHRDEYGYFTGCVEGSGFTRTQCSFTSFGRTSVDFAAPGTDIISSVVPGDGTQGPADEYDLFNGTSMASPMAAGIAGLVLAQHPTYGPVQVKNAIMNSVDTPASLKQYIGANGSFSRTNGRMNADAAIDGSTTNATTKNDGSITGAVPIVASKSGSVDWPSDANDVFRKRLQQGERYRVTLKTFAQRVDFYVWNPTTVDMWQLTAGCLGGPGACPLMIADSIGPNRVVTGRFRANKTGAHYFVLESFYKTTTANYAITIQKV